MIQRIADAPATRSISVEVAAEEYCGGLFTDQWLSKGDETDTIRRKLDWNSLRIIARGAHIQVTLNGAKVVDYVDPNPPRSF
jgi:hypothetical protein